MSTNAENGKCLDFLFSIQSIIFHSKCIGPRLIDLNGFHVHSLSLFLVIRYQINVTLYKKKELSRKKINSNQIEIKITEKKTVFWLSFQYLFDDVTLNLMNTWARLHSYSSILVILSRIYSSSPVTVSGNTHMHTLLCFRFDSIRFE